jgi:hypothetical protein
MYSSTNYLRYGAMLNPTNEWKPAQFDEQTIASPRVAFASLSFAIGQLFLRRPPLKRQQANQKDGGMLHKRR